MLSTFDEFALEVRYLDRAIAFYEETLGLTGSHTSNEAVYEIGDTTLVLREPSTIPRGGLHAHYAFSTPESAYAEWYERLDRDFDLVEHEFGTARSLYLDDPDGHGVEIGTVGGTDVNDTNGHFPLTGVFEVVLEVEALDSAVSFYETLGFSVVDRGGDRERVRLSGPVDLELWKPQLGIADARGAVHADLTFLTTDPQNVASSVAERASDVTNITNGVRIRDSDCHYLTVRTH